MAEIPPSQRASALPVFQRNGDAPGDQEPDRLIEPEDGVRLRRAANEAISQRLYSIVLAVHAAETGYVTDPARVARILEFIRTNSEACLEELCLLGDLR